MRAYEHYRRLMREIAIEDGTENTFEKISIAYLHQLAEL